MFAKGKITQSMIDAVNSVLGETKEEVKQVQLLDEEKKQMLLEPELDETGFHKAAHAAKKASQSHFEFQGKKYPVTAKSHAEALAMEASEKVPTPTGMKVYGSSYGNSAKARKDQTKSAVDTLKGPKTKELQEDGDCVTKPQAKDIAKKEVGKHEKGMHGKKGEVAQHVKSMHKESTFADKLIASLNEAKSTGTEEIFTDNNLGEEEMTDAQMKKREKIVMSMKKGEAGFKQRYGKNWKNVMYATATKQAMKEDSSDTWEDLEEATPAKNTDIADKAYLKHKPGTVKGTMTQLGRFLRGKPEIKEETIEEKNESHTHAAHYENDKGEWTGMNLLTAKDDEDAIKQAHSKCKEGCRLSRVERHTTVKEEMVNEAEVTTPAKDADKVTTDMLRGRELGGKSNSFKSFKQQLKTNGEMKAPTEIDTGTDTKEKQKITTNPGAIDVKFDDKLSTPPQHYFSNEKQIANEAFRGEMKVAHAKSKAAHNKDIDTFNKKVAQEEVQVDEKVIAGTPGWEKIKGTDKKGNVTDKSGAVHTPMSRARDLARKSFTKLKNETMMGKIGTSE